MNHTVSENTTEANSFLNAIREDISRYIDTNTYTIMDVIKCIYRDECLQFIICFRVCQSVLKIDNIIIRSIVKFIFITLIYRSLSILLGIHISIDCTIAPGIYIGHPGCIFIGATKLGKYCNISHEVTIGIGKLQSNTAIPIIGDYVYIGPGAKLFGDITIGNNVSIGANAVVSKTIPNGAIVMGNPGRIVGYQDKNEQIHNIANKTYVGILKKHIKSFYCKRSH
jgi:serine O-acetyltransferase